MNACSKCGTDNPQGSKFCAGCGAALPKNERCLSCGAESPEGSRFCKGCGKSLNAVVVQTPNNGTGWKTRGGQFKTAVAGPGIQRIKAMLIAGACLYAVGIFLMYSQISALQSMYGVYAGSIANTDLQWFLIVVDLVCGVVSLYAVTQLNSGQLKLPKTMFIVMIALGAIFLLLGLAGPLLYSLLNAALLAAGVYGRMLIAREQLSTV